MSPRQLIEVSRPGLWATHLWFYLLPLGGRDQLSDVGFWLGATYVMFPMGLLLYGWNDWADYETDQLNPRKGNLLFGARLSADQLHRLPWMIAAVQLPFFAAMLWLVGPKFLWWIAAALAINACYNLPALNFKGKPVLDVLAQSGYLLVFVLSSWLNDVPQLAWPVFVFGLLFAMHSHLLGEIADIEPDRAAGRRTTAVVIGAASCKLVVAAMLLIESVIVWWHLHEGVSTSSISFSLTDWRNFVPLFLVAAGLGFLIDYIARGDKLVSNRQLAAVLIAWNVVAVASMYFVWRGNLFGAH